MAAALSIVSITGTSSTCKNGATITITVTGQNGNVQYSLLDANKVLVPGKQVYDAATTHTFTGLPGGTYYASVSDASPSSEIVSTTGATVTVNYTDMVITAPSVMVGCLTATTTVTVTATLGSGVYTNYRLYNSSGFDVSQTSGVFTNVPKGAYTIAVTDNCGVIQTSSTNVNVTNATVNSFNANNAWVRYSDPGKCDNNSRLSVYTEMGSVSLNPNSITTFDRQHFYWCYRYPAGDGGTVYGLDASNNPVATTLENGRTYAVPISTSMLPLPPGVENDFINANMNTDAADIIIYDDCGTYVINTKKVKQKYNNAYVNGTIECSNGLGGGLLLGSNVFYGPYCYPLTVTIKNLSDAVVGTYIIPAYTSPHYQDEINAGLTPGVKYKITVTDSKGLFMRNNVEVTIPTVVPSTNVSQSENSMFYYDSRTFSLTFGTSLSNTTLTYVVQSTTAQGVPANFTGTIVGTDISSSGPYTFKGPNSDGSWPAGQYTVKFTTNPSNNCMNNVNYTFTVAAGIQASFNRSATVITPRCGRFDADLKVTSNVSGIKAYIKEGPSGVGTIKTFTSSSGVYTVKFDNLSYGTYKIGLVGSGVTSITTATNKHLIDSVTVTYAANNALTIDALKTGGYICTGTTTDLVITASSASGSALQYSYIPSGSSTYSAWQNSNSFPNVPAGTYPVRVKDECGNTTTYNAVVTDKPIPSSTANPVCEGEPVTMGIAVPGGQIYTWYKRHYSSSSYVDTQISTSSNPYYTLPNNVQVTDSGTYKVIVTTNNASCPTVESHFILGVNPRPTATITYGNAVYCTSDADPTPTLSNVVGTNVVAGTYSASPTGLAINSSTGKIDLSESKAGNYTVSYSFQDDKCHNTATTPVRINGVTLVVNSPVIAYKPNRADLTAAAITVGTSASEGGNITFRYFTDANGANTLTNPNAVVSGTYYIQAVSASGCLSAIKPVEVIVKANYWVGTHTTNWGSDFNWADVRVPATGEDVEFATTENNSGNPAENNLELDANYTIGSLVNVTEFATIIPVDKSLIVQGSVTGSETAANAGKLIIKADVSNPNGTFIANCAAQTAAGKDIYATVEMYSSAYKSPTLFSWTDNIVGSPTLGQEFSYYYVWQYFGSPVESVTASPTFDGSYVREYNEALNGANYYQKWTQLSNGSIISKFKGYEVTQNIAQGVGKKFTIQGKLVICDQPITLTAHAAEASNGVRYGLGYNIFGNSFTSAIPIADLDFPTNVENTVYLYNTGAFAQWGASHSSMTNPSATVAGSYKAIPKNTASLAAYKSIPSMNGFLLLYNGAYNSQTTMTLPYGTLVKNADRQTAPRAPLSYLDIELSSASTSDRLLLVSQAGTTAGFDDGWDGRKFFGTPTAYIYAPTSDGNMEISTNNTLDGSYINFVGNNETDYTLSVKKVNLDQDYTALYLVDLYTGAITALDDEITHYSFTASNVGTADQRFLISASPGVVTDSERTQSGSTSAYIVDGKIFVSNESLAEASLNLYDAIGRHLYSGKVPTQSVEALPLHLVDGVYMISIVTGKENLSLKLVVNNN